MPGSTSQHHAAAASSARHKITRSIVERLESLPRPLTAEQRNRIIAAAVAIPTTEDYPSTGGAR
jgi:hypothetical protein